VDQEATCAGPGYVLEGRQTSLIPFDNNDLAGALEQQGSRKPSRPGPDLKYNFTPQWPRLAGNTPRQIQIQKEVLTQ
jgi:hypothetical protein